MAQPVALPQQVPIQQPIPEPVGNLQEREISDLADACLNKDADNGAVGQRVIVVATIVIAIAALFLIEGVLGILAFAGTLLFGGDLASLAYHKYRGHEYLDASKALGTPAFKEFFTLKNIQPTIDNILIVHQQYKDYAIDQAQRIAQRA